MRIQRKTGAHTLFQRETQVAKQKLRDKCVSLHQARSQGGRREAVPPAKPECPLLDRMSGLLRKIEIFMGCSVGFRYVKNALATGPYWGSSRRSPRPLSRLRGGTPVPMPNPPRYLDSRAFDASIPRCISLVPPLI